MKDTSQLVDMYQGVLDGAGWTTDDYILNAKHSPLSDKEKVVLILQLSKAGILADANKITGKEKEKNQVPSEAFMSPHDVMSKHGKGNNVNESWNGFTQKVKNWLKRPNRSSSKEEFNLAQKVVAKKYGRKANIEGIGVDKRGRIFLSIVSSGGIGESDIELVLNQDGSIKDEFEISYNYDENVNEINWNSIKDPYNWFKGKSSFQLRIKNIDKSKLNILVKYTEKNKHEIERVGKNLWGHKGTLVYWTYDATDNILYYINPKAKSIYDKFIKQLFSTNESVNEARQTYSKPNKAATKKLKGMVKIKAVQFKQGHNFYYYDKKTKKWWFVDSEGDLMELRSEYVLKQVYAFIKQNQINIDESISKDDKFKIYNKLKKGDIIDIDYGSSIRKTTKGKFKVSKGKTIVGKRKVERIILQNIANPTGTKYYLYNSGGSIGMAIGDMAATINSMQKSVNEAGEYVEKHNNENKISMQIYKKVGGNEIKFYDELEHLHDKMGHPKYMKWLSGALRGYNVDMFRTSKIKNKGEAEEALYILSKK